MLLSFYIIGFSILVCLAWCPHWIYSHVCYKRIWLLCAGPSQGYVSPSAYTGPYCRCVSTIGLTSELYAFYFVVVDPMFRFLRWDPSILLALPHMLLMWFVQRRSDVMRQPRYFASRTINSVNVVSVTGARSWHGIIHFLTF